MSEDHLGEGGRRHEVQGIEEYRVLAPVVGGVSNASFDSAGRNSAGTTVGGND